MKKFRPNENLTTEMNEVNCCNVLINCLVQDKIQYRVFQNENLKNSLFTTLYLLHT